jgi:DNA processing protein
MQENCVFELALNKIEGVGSVLYRILINHFGSAQAVFDAPYPKLEKVPGISKVLISRIKNSEIDFKGHLDLLKKSERLGIKLIDFKNPLYPKRLLNVFDAPPLLYMKGKGSANYARSLAIVGTRDASPYGKDMVNKICEGLAKSKVQIVSGLAYGVDITAHKSALKNGLSTIGVLANSLDGVYPEAHYGTAQEILEKGLLISEHPIGTETKQKFFVARNRIIAGMSDVVIVIESVKKGGGMITAKYANNYNREVFALPGNINQKYSEGPNFLISNQLAQIFTDIDAFLDWMNWENENDTESVSIPSLPVLDLSKFSQEESSVLSALIKNGEMQIDEIAWQTSIHLNKLASVLLNLEFQDLVKQSPGKKFKIKA